MNIDKITALCKKYKVAKLWEKQLSGKQLFAVLKKVCKSNDTQTQRIWSIQ